MKKFTLLLLLYFVTFYPIKGISQVISQTVISAEREISNTKDFKPIKSKRVFREMVISLTQVSMPSINIARDGYVLPNLQPIYPIFDSARFSYFILSSETGSVIECVRIPHLTITDFDYDINNDKLYFCGVYKLSGQIFNIVGDALASSLFNGNVNTVNLYVINLPDSMAYLEKIDFYEDKYQNKKLSLIANNNYSTTAYAGVNMPMTFPSSFFISYNIQNYYYQVFETHRMRLTDVIHTQDKIVLSGLAGINRLVLFSHKQGNLNNYVGKSFETYNLFTNCSDVKYNITPLSKNNNHVVVGSSLMNNPEIGGYLEFALFSMDYGIDTLNKQGVSFPNNTYVEGRSKISEMKFDENTGILYVLACNGNALLHIKDMIMPILPYKNTNYTTNIIVPNHIDSSFNSLKSIVLYGKNDQNFLTFGALSNSTIDSISYYGNLYFFDGNIFLGEQCAQTYTFDILPIKSKYEENKAAYYKIYDDKVQNILQESFTPMTREIDILCIKNKGE